MWYTCTQPEAVSVFLHSPLNLLSSGGFMFLLPSVIPLCSKQAVLEISCWNVFPHLFFFLIFKPRMHLVSRLDVRCGLRDKDGCCEEVTGAFEVNEQQLGNKWPWVVLTLPKMLPLCLQQSGLNRIMDRSRDGDLNCELHKKKMGT